MDEQQGNPNKQQGAAQAPQTAQSPEQGTPGSAEGDAQGDSASEPQMSEHGQEKLWAILGYIISILFFVPLVSDELKRNAFSRFHANQQLILLITWVVSWFLMPFFGLGFLVQLFALVLMIMGIVNASGGKMKKLPLIGGITLIK